MTGDAHDRLDIAMQRASGWRARDDYARFLTLQYGARKPVEDALSQHLSKNRAPPSQAALIAHDLAEMDAPLPEASKPFDLCAPEVEGTLTGAVWVLAGSALGNRAILKDILAQPSGRAIWPHTFLADEAMLRYWSGLRRRIERPANTTELHAATAGALSVFKYFIEIAEKSLVSTRDSVSA